MAPGIIGLQLETKYVPLNRKLGELANPFDIGETGLHKQSEERKDRKGRNAISSLVPSRWLMS